MRINMDQAFKYCLFAMLASLVGTCVIGPQFEGSRAALHAAELRRDGYPADWEKIKTEAATIENPSNAFFFDLASASTIANACNYKLQAWVSNRMKSPEFAWFTSNPTLPTPRAREEWQQFASMHLGVGITQSVWKHLKSNDVEAVANDCATAFKFYGPNGNKHMLTR
jgi:hypothetical protein